MEKLSEFLDSNLSNGLSMAPGGYCNVIELKDGNWRHYSCTAGIFTGHAPSSEKFYMMPNKEMSKEEIFSYLADRELWTTEGNPRGI